MRIDGDIEITVEDVSSLVVEPIEWDDEEEYPTYRRDIVITTSRGTIRLALDSMEKVNLSLRKKPRPVKKLKVAGWLEPKIYEVELEE